MTRSLLGEMEGEQTSGGEKDLLGDSGSLLLPDCCRDVSLVRSLCLRTAALARPRWCVRPAEIPSAQEPISSQSSGRRTAETQHLNFEDVLIIPPETQRHFLGRSHFAPELSLFFCGEAGELCKYMYLYIF